MSALAIHRQAQKNLAEAEIIGQAIVNYYLQNASDDSADWDHKGNLIRSDWQPALTLDDLATFDEDPEAVRAAFEIQRHRKIAQAIAALPISFQVVPSGGEYDSFGGMAA
jgi:hypothetical protein